MNHLICILLSLVASGPASSDYLLPFSGRWFVMQGGDTLNVNEHMRVRAQAFGLDFAKVAGPSQRELTSATPSKPEDFFSWGQAVLSPCPGEVISAVDTLPDNPLGTKDPAHPFGNHVVIKVAPSQFVVLAHFQRGSIAVSSGQRISRGQVLGKCGNSGNSDFPHIHMHVQDAAEPNSGQGQNIPFAHINVELSGKQFPDVSWPLIRGLFVENR